MDKSRELLRDVTKIEELLLDANSSVSALLNHFVKVAKVTNDNASVEWAQAELAGKFGKDVPSYRIISISAVRSDTDVVVMGHIDPTMRRNAVKWDRDRYCCLREIAGLEYDEVSNKVRFEQSVQVIDALVRSGSGCAQRVSGEIMLGYYRISNIEIEFSITELLSLLVAIRTEMAKRYAVILQKFPDLKEAAMNAHGSSVTNISHNSGVVNFGNVGNDIALTSGDDCRVGKTSTETCWSKFVVPLLVTVIGGIIVAIVVFALGLNK